MGRATRPEGCCPPQRVPALRRRAANARLLAALRAAAHPTRLQVLQLLSSAGAAVCVCDITARFDLSQPTISHHLGILRRAGLVEVSRRGVWAHYAIRREGLETLRDGLSSLDPESGGAGSG